VLPADRPAGIKALVSYSECSVIRKCAPPFLVFKIALEVTKSERNTEILMSCWLGETNVHNMERINFIQNISVMMIDNEPPRIRKTTYATVTHQLQTPR
jgi:hypothetical protein